MDKPLYHNPRFRYNFPFSKIVFWAAILIVFIYFISHSTRSSNYSSATASRRLTDRQIARGWEKRVKKSGQPREGRHHAVLVTGAAGFVGSHVSAALKRRGDGVVGLDNFNNYYDPSLKRARRALLDREKVYVVEGDINDTELLFKLFDLVNFTHVMHLAAQAGVRYNISKQIRGDIWDLAKM